MGYTTTLTTTLERDRTSCPFRRGTSLSGMSEIAGSPLVNLTGINVADVNFPPV